MIPVIRFPFISARLFLSYHDLEGSSSQESVENLLIREVERERQTSRYKKLVDSKKLVDRKEILLFLERKDS